MPLSLTAAAAAQIRKAGADAGELALRVAARRGADGEIAYGLGFDEMREGDLPLEVQGVRLLVAPPSQALLEDTRVDYVELEPGRFAFIFVPAASEPAAPASAGCGSGGCSGCAGRAAD